jgi:hypothetical protein
MTGFGRYRRRSKRDGASDQRPAESLPAEPTDDVPSGDVPADDMSGLTEWQASRWAEIHGANPHCVIGYGQARTDMVAGLRALADFLEANPAVPIPRYGHTFGVSTSGSDEQRLAQVKFASLVIGEQTTDNTQNHGHYWAQRRFGPVSYRIVAVSQAAMRRWQEATSRRDSKHGADSFSRTEDDQ